MGTQATMGGVRDQAGQQQQANQIAGKNNHAVVEVFGNLADARAHQGKHEFGGNDVQGADEQAVMLQGDGFNWLLALQHYRAALNRGEKVPKLSGWSEQVAYFLKQGLQFRK